jgi:hypothetical protein
MSGAPPPTLKFGGLFLLRVLLRFFYFIGNNDMDRLRVNYNIFRVNTAIFEFFHYTTELPQSTHSLTSSNNFFNQRLLDSTGMSIIIVSRLIEFSEKVLKVIFSDVNLATRPFPVMAKTIPVNPQPYRVWVKVV